MVLKSLHCSSGMCAIVGAAIKAACLVNRKNQLTITDVLLILQHLLTLGSCLMCVSPTSITLLSLPGEAKCLCQGKCTIDHLNQNSFFLTKPTLE